MRLNLKDDVDLKNLMVEIQETKMKHQQGLQAQMQAMA